MQMTHAYESQLVQMQTDLVSSLDSKMKALQEADTNIDKEWRVSAAKRAAKERKILQDKHVEEMILSMVPRKKGELPPAALAALSEVKGAQPMLGGGGKMKIP